MKKLLLIVVSLCSLNCFGSIHTNMPPRCSLVCDGIGHYSVSIDDKYHFSINNVFTNEQDAIERAWSANIPKIASPDYNDFNFRKCEEIKPSVISGVIQYTNLSNFYWTNEPIFQFKSSQEANFITISNRTSILLYNYTIIRVNDKEWDILTNHYSKYLNTNTITFYDEEK